MPTELLSIAQTAEELVVSVTTVRRLVASREFKHATRVGRQIRIPRSDLEAYLQRQRDAAFADDEDDSDVATNSQ